MERISVFAEKEGRKMINTKKLMKKAAGASTGVAVAAAFFNVALLVVQLAKTVSEGELLKPADDAKPEEKN